MNNILMNTEMAKAILDGRKTQARRVVKVRTDINKKEWVDTLIPDYAKYKIGETIWVKEPFVIEGSSLNKNGILTYHEEPIVHYKASEKDLKWIDEWEDEVNVPWKSAIHMNKEMARIFLKITDVRVERLQDITFQDTTREGLPFDVDICCEDIGHKAKLNTAIFDSEVEMKVWWINAWNKTAPKGYKWDDNPYVFVYEFETTHGANR